MVESLNNPEQSVNFYSKVSGFVLQHQTNTTPPGITNHHGHPLHYPFLLAKASQTHLLAASTNKVVQIYDI
jgi:hypothetical protein